jgi:hypothetical protein
MVYAWPASPAADALLFMNEAHAHRRRRRRRVKRRTLERRLARATEQIEHSEPYQASLRRVVELGHEFQRGLTEPQRAHWLHLEDALLEHTQHLQRAYFEAGVQVGEGSRDEPIEDCSSSFPRRGRRRFDTRSDALSMLGRLLIELARR